MIPFSTPNIWHEHNIWVYKCTSLLISRTLYLCKTPDNSRVDDPLTGYDVRPLESFVPAQLPSCRWHKQLEGRSEILEIMVFKVTILQHCLFFLFFIFCMWHMIKVAFHWHPVQFQIGTLGGKMEKTMNCFSLFNRISTRRGHIVPPLLRICVFLCKYAYELVEKTWLFSVMSLEKGSTLFTP